MNRTDRKQRSRHIDIQNLVYGKMPPQSKDLEGLVLGAILLEPGTLERVTEFISDESFYVPANQTIFQAALSLQKKGQPTDTGMIVEELKTIGKLEEVGGPYYVTTLTKAVTSTANIEAHAKVIAQKFLMREMIRVGMEMINDAYEDSMDAFQLLDSSEEQLLNLGRRHVQGDVKGIDTVLVKAVKKIEEWRQLKTHVTGVASGFPKLDRATRGWQNTDLIILAARPSVGKTSLALQLGRNAALDPVNPVPVAIWSLEMEDVQLVLRMLASESGLMLHSIQTGRLSDTDMGQLFRRGIQTLANTKLFIDDEPGCTLLKLRAKARRLKKKHNIGLLIVDYLQLMSGESTKGNREQEISAISRGLKLLAKELKIPIIALSQLNREVEKRTGSKKVPQVGDLRESGAIEQDADVIMLVWGPDEDEIQQDAGLANRRYVRIGKARNGMLVTIDFEIDKDTQKWREYDEGFGNFKPLPPSNNYYETDKDEPF